jgi:hypothetical protein
VTTHGTKRKCIEPKTEEVGFLSAIKVSYCLEIQRAWIKLQPKGLKTPGRALLIAQYWIFAGIVDGIEGTHDE